MQVSDPSTYIFFNPLSTFGGQEISDPTIPTTYIFSSTHLAHLEGRKLVIQPDIYFLQPTEHI